MISFSKCFPEITDLLGSPVKYLFDTSTSLSTEQLITRFLKVFLLDWFIPLILWLKSDLASPAGEPGLSIEEITPNIPSSNFSEFIDFNDHSIDSLNALKVSLQFGSRYEKNLKELESNNSNFEKKYRRAAIKELNKLKKILQELN